MKKTVLSLLVAVGLIGSSNASIVYSNNLKDSTTLSSDFTDNSGFDNASTNGLFKSDPSYGLQLTSPSRGLTYYNGVQTYNTTLSANQDWTVSVIAHLDPISNFTTNSDPLGYSFYACGFDIAKYANNLASTVENRFNLILVNDSTGYTSGINSSLFVKDTGSGISVLDKTLTRSSNDIYLKISYSAFNKKASTLYSYDGVNFSNIDTYDLFSSWGLQSNDQLVVSMTGAAFYDYGQITGSQISLSNFSIVPEPSTYALFGTGAIGMLMVIRRKKTA